MYTTFSCYTNFDMFLWINIFRLISLRYWNNFYKTNICSQEHIFDSKRTSVRQKCYEHMFVLLFLTVFCTYLYFIYFGSDIRSWLPPLPDGYPSLFRILYHIFINVSQTHLYKIPSRFLFIIMHNMQIYVYNYAHLILFIKQQPVFLFLKAYRHAAAARRRDDAAKMKEETLQVAGRFLWWKDWTRFILLYAL